MVKVQETTKTTTKKPKNKNKKTEIIFCITTPVYQVTASEGRLNWVMDIKEGTRCNEHWVYRRLMNHLTPPLKPVIYFMLIT